MSGDRRAFLRQLVTLPLIGGSVNLIGQPTAVAEPPSRLTLEHYSNWLFYERRFLCGELAAGDVTEACRLENFRDCRIRPEFHFPDRGSWTDVPKPSTRAALIMSAAGFDWRA